LTDHQMVQDRLALTLVKEHSKNALEELLGFARHALREISKFTSPTIIFDLQKYYPEIWKKFEDFQDEIIYKFVKENIDRGISESLYRDDLDADIIAKLYVTKTMCVIDEDMFPTRQYDKVKLFKQYFYYHIRGIATTKGLKLLEKYISEFTPEKPI
jgi:TetR/AcrR family transcriptional regulator, cholesterol catabolism regulator